MKRLPNNYGGVAKYNDGRSKPYRAWIPKKTVNTGCLISSQYIDVEELRDYISSKTFNNKGLESDLRSLVSKYSADDYNVETKRVTLGFYETYNEALNALAEHNRMPVDGKVMSMTVADIWRIIKPKVFEGISKSQQSSYNKAFKDIAILHNEKIAKVRTADMQRCIDEIYKTAPSMQRASITLLKAIYKYAIENDIVQKNYSDYIVATPYDTEGAREPYSREEIARLWEHQDFVYHSRKKLYDGFPIAKFVLVLIYTGLRPSELTTVKTEHVHKEERYIEVYGTKTTNAKRIVPIHKKILPLLESDSEYLFHTNKGKAKYDNIMVNAFPELAKVIGTDKDLYSCRHTFVSLATTHGVNQVLLKKMVGHSTQDITQAVYTHAYIEDLVREIDKIDE